MSDLTGRSAVVTGAARGIGRAIAVALADAGAAVVLGDLDGDGAEAAAADLRDDGHDAVARACDVTDETAVEALAQAAVDRTGGLDVWVNNAGITRDRTMHKMPPEDFDAVVDVHLRGTWLGTRAALTRMRDADGGAIVNLSSISGKVGNFGQTNYSAAKAGIVGLTKAAAREGARYGVRVNAVQPGLIRTRMTEEMPQGAWDAKLESIPMGRAGQPGDVADVVAFLAGDGSRYMTGAVLEVTGGRHM